MWKYILGSVLCFFGVVEIVLSRHKRLREALMQNSPIRAKGAESHMLLLAGVSALVMGVGMLFFGYFW